MNINELQVNQTIRPRSFISKKVIMDSGLPEIGLTAKIKNITKRGNICCIDMIDGLNFFHLYIEKSMAIKLECCR